MKKYQLLSAIILSVAPFHLLAEQPKLVLQITVDQLRADLPSRYMKNMGEKGFKYLYKNGAVYHNAFHPHANTETIVGHATLATGATPAVHGMIGNTWFDRNEQRLVYNIEDPNYVLLSKNADVNKATEIDPTQKAARSSGRSPSNMLVSTFSDELLAYTSNQAKVFAVSVKDRGAVSMAGHKGKAFWFSKKSGQFVTSNYYYDQYPTWVNEWNDQNHFLRYQDANWSLMYDESRYLFNGKDDQAGEINFPGFGNTFPHAYGNTKNKYFTTFLTLSPAGDELTADFAKQLIASEKLGQDKVTDYLSVSFSSTDYIGHMFGASSLEMEDNLLRLDRTIASLLDYIDNKVGLRNTLIVLSSDHGGPDSVEYAKEQGLNAQAIKPKTWQLETLSDQLMKAYKTDKPLILSFQAPYIYLDHEVIKQHKLDKGQVEQTIVEYFKQFPEIASAVSSVAIEQGKLQPTQEMMAVANNHNAARSGDIYLVFSPHSFINDMEGLHVAVHHGSPWRYDQHVPIVFAGHNVKPHRVYDQVSTTDIAPTLSAYIGALSPSGANGKVLTQVVEKQP
ncbi:alkaline phosphatase family protein [Thalassotalea sp. LPB0316]|nr:alkaline phosphatase family protein [Thalassotalea sp. LPB0316]